MYPKIIHAKIAFELTQDEDGYPPHSVESVWTLPLGDGRYQIANIPFFVEDIAIDDVVTAEAKEGRLWFKSLVEPSKHSTIKVIVYSRPEIDALLDLLKPLECIVEASEHHPLVVIDIAPEMSLLTITEVLDIQGAVGKLEYWLSADRHWF